MALFEIGSAADEAAVDVPGRRDPVVPQCETPDHLLDAVRRGLVAGDPVARLLAGWPLAPAPAVGIPRTRSGTGRSGPEPLIVRAVSALLPALIAAARSAHRSVS